MSGSKELIASLKKELKFHGLTYADVAKALDLSEASVKRMFSVGHFTLDRLSAICDLIGFEFADLVRVADERKQRISHLSIDQEKELVKDLKLFTVAVLVRNHYSFEQIINEYQFEEGECFQLLARLERIKLIDIFPFNRIKLRVAEDFRWLPNGPIEQLFEGKFLREFLDSRFDGDNEFRIYLHGLLSASSQDQFLLRLKSLVDEFSSRLKMDTRRELSEKEGVGLLLAFRAWQPSMFASVRAKRD